MPSLEIYNREPPEAKTEWTGYMISFVIRTTMNQRPSHSFYSFRDDRCLVVKVVLSANTAHDFKYRIQKSEVRSQKKNNKLPRRKLRGINISIGTLLAASYGELDLTRD
jgi:hypothetical protein